VARCARSLPANLVNLLHAAQRRMRISNPCVAKLTLAITKFQMEQVSDGNALEQNLEVADLKTRA
jgi:hypothetical protein